MALLMPRCAGACPHQASLISGTMFEASKLSLTRWFLAMQPLTQPKSNVPALELMRQLGICYRRAWLLKHEIMEAMRLPSAAEIAKALTSNWRGEHLFVLAQSLAMYDTIARNLDERDAKLQALLTGLGQSKVDLGKAPRVGSKLRQEFDARQILVNWAGVDLTRTNGLGLTAVMKILSEIGPDLSRFETVKHFYSWLGLCPGTKIGGGKVLSAKTKRSANRERQALKMVAMNLPHSDSAFDAFYRRLCSRMDKPRANSAVAHKVARTVHSMLTRGEPFVGKGQQQYEEQLRQRRVAALKRRAAALGFEINPTTAPVR